MNQAKTDQPSPAESQKREMELLRIRMGKVKHKIAVISGKIG